MKKIFIISFSLFFLASCFSSTTQEDLDKAKDDLLSGNSGIVFSSVTSSGSNNLENTSSKNEKSTEGISVKYLTEEKFIEIDDFLISDFLDLEQEITGKTLENVDKIIVTFSNPLSSFKNDTFQLKKFKSGDKTFLYRAFKKYESLDYGENIYTFEAYVGDKVSKLEYKVFLEKPEENKEELKVENKEFQPITSADISSFPTSPTFGNPVELGNGKITYSDLKGLEIEQIGEINLENTDTSVTEFIKSRYKNIFYWNTKRPIGTKGLSFFVVRTEGNRYFYEKHYYTGKFYGVLSLESGDFLAEGTVEEKANSLKELNISLREKNSDFPIEKIANTLFQNF